MLKVKVCGLTDEENFSEVAKLGVDYLGLIFVPSSPRFVPSERALTISRKERFGAKLVGVFRDHSIQEISSLITALNLDAVQLHGSEEDEFITELRATHPAIQIIKAVSSSALSPSVGAEFTKAQSAISLFLIDNKSGGTGEKFNWSVFKETDAPGPFLLAGGLGPDDASAIVALMSETKNLRGVDLNSGFESAAGIKDTLHLRRFLTGIGRRL